MRDKRTSGGNSQGKTDGTARACYPRHSQLEFKSLEHTLAGRQAIDDSILYHSQLSVFYNIDKYVGIYATLKCDVRSRMR